MGPNHLTHGQRIGPAGLAGSPEAMIHQQRQTKCQELIRECYGDSKRFITLAEERNEVEHTKPMRCILFLMARV